MKLKLLLTICLLLITSQVFAKKMTLYNCPTETDARSCNNCGKNPFVKVVNVKVNANKVLIQYVYKDDSGRPISNTYLQTVKHENSRIRQVTGELALLTKKETLDVFDEDNWEFLNNSSMFYTSTNQIRTMMEIEKSMVNGKYYEMRMFAGNPPIYRCGK
ncbi:hypothetical protein N8Y84_00085 [bacterium]|nr:hypothetical protein [bacterium]